MEKFLLLLWKHWITVKQRWIFRFLDCSIAVLICVLVLYLKPDRTHEPAKNYSSFEISSNFCKSENGEQKVVYSPKNTFLEEGIKASCWNLSNIEGFNDSFQLKKLLDGSQFRESIGAAVFFNDELRGIKDSNDLTITNNIKITMRFQDPESKLQLGSFQPGKEAGYDPKDLFLPFQEAISSHLIHKSNSSELRIVLQQFPKPERDKSNDYVNIFGDFAALILTYAFALRYKAQVEEIAREKELQSKVLLEVMGFPDWLLLVLWIIFCLFFYLVHIGVMILLLAVGYGDFVLFTSSDPSILFLFFFVAACCAITFSLLISSFLNTEAQASLLAIAIFLIAQIPFVLAACKSFTTEILLTVCLLFPTAATYGLHLFITFEYTGEGVQWYNIWDDPPTRGVSLGAVFLMLLLDTILYLVLAVYIEKVSSGTQPWYFRFQKSYWFSKHPEENNEDSSIDVAEVPPNLPAAIRVKNLTKKFGNQTVVKNLNLSLYEGQITVLLGHNGAGKTTTMNMMAGVIPPSGGTIKIYNYDLTEMRQNLGVCFQEDVLFEEMTIQEHLYFVCKLRSLPIDIIDDEIKKYLKLLKLEGKEKSLPKDLSEGMKRKLCIAMALCGKPKVVMLDEPTASLDFSTRKDIWNLLQEQKEGKTILLSTHFMDEAYLLGDRIAILSNGELQCCGSGSFIKKKYATDYHLILEVTPRCQPDQVTNSLRSHISDLKLSSYTNSQLTYKLPKNESHKFEAMLRNLESNSASLNVTSYRITPVSFEEIFLKTQLETQGQEKDTKVFVTGVHLVMNQILAMVLKRSLCMLNSWFLLLFTQILMPIVIFLLLVVNPFASGDKQEGAFRISLDSYRDPVTLLEADHENIYAKSYEKVVEGHNFEKVANITATIIETGSRYRKYVVAASFTGGSVTAWFNGEHPNSAPLALALVYNAYVKVKWGDKYSLNFINHPLPRTNDLTTLQIMVIAWGWTLGILFFVGFYILFYVGENVCKAKHLQLISGVNPFIFWIVPLILDLVLYHITVCILVVVAVIGQVGGFTTLELTQLTFVLSTFGFFVLPFMYLSSALFTYPARGCFFVIILGLLTGMILSALMFGAYEAFGVKLEDQQLIFHFFPFYSLINGVSYLMKANIKKEWCEDVEYQTIKDCDFQKFPEKCRKYKMCQELFENSHFAMDKDHLGIGILISYCLGIICFIFLLLKDYGYFRFLFKFKKKPKETYPVDEEVKLETDTIMNTPQSHIKHSYPLFLRDLTKYYGATLAVNGFSLGVKSEECFGLIGASGVGKTTIFRMITNDASISNGGIFIAGLSLEKKGREAVKPIGYSPQSYSLLEELTPRQTLRIFALLRGVPWTKCKELSEGLAEKFDFSEFLDTKIEKLSGGNRKKLSVSLALIGDFKILCLDEPTSGMDPNSKRLVWNALTRVKQSGKSIILSSQDLQECEALCTRACVMVKGTMKCIGSVRRLKSKFAQGFNLTIKIKKVRNKYVIHEFVRSSFPKAILKEAYHDMVTYQIPDTIPPSKIFGTIEENKERLGIEDYWVGQGTLEQVFLNFME